MKVNRERVGSRIDRELWTGVVVMAISLASLVGCGSLNPAFVDLVDPSGQSARLDNAPGHVVIQFLNNAEVDERLISFLESAGGGNLQLTAAEKRALRPRVRLRVQVTFRNGVRTTFEIVDGSANLIDQNFSAQAFPDLNQNDLDNLVVVCDVQSVTIMPGSTDVFIPTALQAYQLAATNTGGVTDVLQFVRRDLTLPRFQPLQVDQVDQDGNVTVVANVGLRDQPAPITDPICGSVITITMDGVLRVPFLDGVDDSPSFDQDDAQAVASIGGRYEFRVGVQ